MGMFHPKGKAVTGNIIILTQKSPHHPGRTCQTDRWWERRVLSKCVTMSNCVAVLLVLWSDNRRYEGGSGSRPSRAAVIWAQIELKHGGEVLWRSRRLDPISPICGCSRAVWWLGRGVQEHTEDVERSHQQIMFHRNTETVTSRRKQGGKGRWNESHGFIWRQNAWQAKPGSYKQLDGSLLCHLDSLSVLVEKFLWVKYLALNIFLMVYPLWHAYYFQPLNVHI